MTNDLKQATDATLISGLPESLKRTLREAIAGGMPKQRILKRVAGISGRRSMLYLAAWAYLDSLKGK